MGKSKKKKTAISPAIDFLRSKEAETLISAKNINKVLDKLSEGDRKIAENALNTSREKRFFHWELEFPEVFYDKGREKEKPGFDAVVGNPPWGGGLDRASALFLESYYPEVNDFESYQYFSETSVRLLRMNGLHGFIVPNTYVLNVLANRFRQWMLEKGSFEILLDASDIPLFPDPSVRCVVYIYVRNGRSLLIKVNKIVGIPNENSGIHALPPIQRKDVIDGRPWKNWLRAIDGIKIEQLVESNSIPLGELSKSKQGYIPYRLTTLTKRFGQKEALSIKENRAWHSDKCEDSSYLRELQGQDVGHYEVNWSGTWIKYGPWVSSHVDVEYFSGSRLLFREVTDKPPHRLIVAFSNQIFVHNPSVLNAWWISKEYSPLYALAITNSSLMSEYFFMTCPKSDKGLFPKILVEDVRRLPIRKINFLTPVKERKHLTDEVFNEYNFFLTNRDYTRIIDQVVDLLATQPERSDIIHDLLALLAAKMIEMKKDTHKNVSESLAISIQNTSWLIDQIVYKLYGLTDEEIKIVEGKKERQTIS